jgi:hypothetical protein
MLVETRKAKRLHGKLSRREDNTKTYLRNKMRGYRLD